MKEIGGKKFGQCVLCGVVGQGEKDFICANCADTGKIIMYCRSCNIRAELTEAGQERGKTSLSVSKEEGVPVNKKIMILPGTVISVPVCPLCSGDSKDVYGEVLIYQIREPEKEGVSVGIEVNSLMGF